MTSVAKLNKPAKAAPAKPSPAKSPPAKPSAAKTSAAKVLVAKDPVAKKQITKAPVAKNTVTKGPIANGPIAKALALAAKQKPVIGQMPGRQDGAPMPMALDLPPGELSEAMRAYFDKCREKIGFVPNVLTSYAHDNGKLEAFAAFYNDLMLGPSGLSKLEREMIAVAVSSENHCFYCLAAHGAAVRQLSGDPVLGELLVMNWRAADLSQRHRAMLAFASKVTLHSRQINEADRDHLRKAGFSERDIWDIAAVASFFNMSNRMASAVDMRPNQQYHAQAR
ncbi:uncharacterized peroxidase-related enzyme [Rhizobiales bacterium GAS113]|nr:uncharacterized peroxidase-related enzyme [Rhizobiales bacterium GAS113]